MSTHSSVQNRHFVTRQINISFSRRYATILDKKKSKITFFVENFIINDDLETSCIFQKNKTKRKILKTAGKQAPKISFSNFSHLISIFQAKLCEFKIVHNTYAIYRLVFTELEFVKRKPIYVPCLANCYENPYRKPSTKLRDYQPSRSNTEYWTTNCNLLRV